MRVSLEHLKCFVARDGRNLHHVEPLLEESARCLMSQVVKAEVNDARFFDGSAPSVFKTIPAAPTPEDPPIGQMPRNPCKGFHSPCGEWHLTCLGVFGIG